MKSRNALLIKLLQTLVDEWGHEEVASALASTAASSNDPLLGRAESSQVRKKKAKPSATEQVARAALGGEEGEALLQLATRYDQKLFLPSPADVREFLIMMGERPIAMKDRSEAFRVLLRSLVQLPVERLQRLAQTALHSGPSELGPLSDAIAAAGERLPRQRPASD
jgi:hypothetical protein